MTTLADVRRNVLRAASAIAAMVPRRVGAVTIANEPNQVEHPSGLSKLRGNAMKALAATLALLVSTAAAAQECPMCSSADACIATYVKSASEAEKAAKTAIRDWRQNLDKRHPQNFLVGERPHYKTHWFRKFVPILVA